MNQPPAGPSLVQHRTSTAPAADQPDASHSDGPAQPAASSPVPFRYEKNYLHLKDEFTIARARSRR